MLSFGCSALRCLLPVFFAILLVSFVVSVVVPVPDSVTLTIGNRLARMPHIKNILFKEHGLCHSIVPSSVASTTANPVEYDDLSFPGGRIGPVCSCHFSQLYCTVILERAFFPYYTATIKLSGTGFLKIDWGFLVFFAGDSVRDAFSFSERTRVSADLSQDTDSIITIKSPVKAAVVIVDRAHIWEF